MVVHQFNIIWPPIGCVGRISFRFTQDLVGLHQTIRFHQESALQSNDRRLKSDIAPQRWIRLNELAGTTARLLHQSQPLDGPSDQGQMFGQTIGHYDLIVY